MSSPVPCVVAAMGSLLHATFDLGVLGVVKERQRAAPAPLLREGQRPHDMTCPPGVVGVGADYLIDEVGVVSGTLAASGGVYEGKPRERATLVSDVTQDASLGPYRDIIDAERIAAMSAS